MLEGDSEEWGLDLRPKSQGGLRLGVLGVLRVERRAGEAEAGRLLEELTLGVEVLFRLPECVCVGLGGPLRRLRGGWTWRNLGDLLGIGEQWACARARDS